MGLSRSRTLYLIVLLALAVFSFRSDAWVENVVDGLFAPGRFLGVLAAPVRWLSAGDVRAAQAESEAGARTEMEASRRMLAAERLAARPTQRGLVVDRGFVLAEVVEHLEKQKDVVQIVYNASAHIAPGMPVVCGDVYVGRVKALDAEHPGRALVSLVTGSTFRVGARVETEGGDEKPRATDLVVGGLVAKRVSGGEGWKLAAQFPSDRSIDAGLVRVFEPDALEAEPYRKLANGYLLGDLVPIVAQGLKQIAIEARLEYEGGLSEVAILCPDPRVESDLAVRDPFDDASWIETHVVVDGNPSPWRAGAELAAGSSQGVTERAALSVGPRLVGRATNVRSWSSDAILLGDPGFQVNVIARVDGEEKPLALGRLTSLGFDRGADALLLRAGAKLPRPKPGDAGPRSATLFTGAGDVGIPAGLWIGTAELPADPRVHVLRVQAPQAKSGLSAVGVWRAAQPANDKGDQGARGERPEIGAKSAKGTSE
jgi:hypothetical protein